MYRNIAYLSKDQVMRLFTWDDDGNRMNVDLPYKPYFYIETNAKSKSNKTSLFQTPLKKVEFPNEYRRREAIERYKSGDTEATVRLFENVSPQQQFLIDRFCTVNDSLEFSKYPIKIAFVDIEVYAPGEFPTPEKANDPVNVITVYDNLSNKFYTWGTGEYTPTRTDVVYKNCRSERELLVGFIDYIKSDHPDILSGWNSELFDIPYLINRIQKVVSEDAAKSLSPINVIYNRNLISQFGKYNTRWHIQGMSCVDYLDVYKKFSQGLRESYKLDSIAELELGEKKIDYGNINLAELADKDWKTFVDYNIQDVNLLVRMEEKLRYLELLRMLAYTGLTPFENAMGTLNIITGAAVIQARKDNLVIPTFAKPPGSGEKYEGAYVGEPERGFQDYIVSFDVNSLYPNIMISLNLSPETKVGSIETRDDGKIILHKLKGQSNVLTRENFYKGVTDCNLSVSKAKILFSQNKKGIYPQIVDNFYEERVKIKRRMKKLRRQIADLEKNAPGRQNLQDEYNRLDTKQFTIKIFINTVYGYFGNKHAPMGDPDISRSITLTGQAIIKQSNKILTEYIKDKCDLSDEQMGSAPPIVYNDTDSVYITIKHLINKFNIPFTNKNGKVTKEVHNVVNEIETHLNKEIKKWGESALNSRDCRFEFKRESIASTGLFLQKKRYILHVLDDEGMHVDKFKYTGVEVVRTTMPNAIKPYVKRIIETMLNSKDQHVTNKLLTEAYDVFKSLSIEDISFVMGISQYKTESRDEYGNIKDQCDGFKTYKGMPIHVKAAYYYNLLLERNNLDNTYEAITTGDKVRYFYVTQPNKYGIKSFAYKYYFPGEFRKDIQPDYELMFNKIIYSVIERLYEAVGWRACKPGEMVQTDLFDLLKLD